MHGCIYFAGPSFLLLIVWQKADSNNKGGKVMKYNYPITSGVQHFGRLPGGLQNHTPYLITTGNKIPQGTALYTVSGKRVDTSKVNLQNVAKKQNVFIAVP
jgi:hypothetical protein